MENSLAVFFDEEKAMIGRTPNNVEEKIAMANAMSNVEEKLGDHVNQTFGLVNYYVERIKLVDTDTGEVKTPLRIVLIDSEGRTYHSTANGVANSLKSIITVFGSASDWEEPLMVTVKSVPRGRGRMLILKIGGGDKS